MERRAEHVCQLHRGRPRLPRGQGRMTRTNLFASRKESDRTRFTRHISREQVHGVRGGSFKGSPQIYPEEVRPMMREARWTAEVAIMNKYFPQFAAFNTANGRVGFCGSVRRPRTG